MIVDDERALLPLLERYLRKQGYEPACFYDPVEALAAFRAAGEKFELVMTDLTLEGLSGEELAKAVLATEPGVRVVVMSGYPYSTENFSDEDRPRVTFLQKPFLPAQFREAVERLRPAAARAEETALPVRAVAVAAENSERPVLEAAAPAEASAAPAEASAEPTGASAVPMGASAVSAGASAVAVEASAAPTEASAAPAGAPAPSEPWPERDGEPEPQP